MASVNQELWGLAQGCENLINLLRSYGEIGELEDSAKNDIKNKFSNLSNLAKQQHTRLQPVSDDLETIVQSKLDQRATLQNFVDKKNAEKGNLEADAASQNTEIAALQKLADDAYKEYQKEQKKRDDYNDMIRKCNESIWYTFKCMFSKKELWEAVADATKICEKKWTNYQGARDQLDRRLKQLDYQTSRRANMENLIAESYEQLKSVDDGITLVNAQINVFNAAVASFITSTKDIAAVENSENNGKYSINIQQSIDRLGNDVIKTKECSSAIEETIDNLLKSGYDIVFDKEVQNINNKLLDLNDHYNALKQKLDIKKVGDYPFHQMLPADWSVGPPGIGIISNNFEKLVSSLQPSKSASMNLLKSTNAIKKSIMSANDIILKMGAK
jgi:hypothetical protein